LDKVGIFENHCIAVGNQLGSSHRLPLSMIAPLRRLYKKTLIDPDGIRSSEPPTLGGSSCRIEVVGFLGAFIEWPYLFSQNPMKFMEKRVLSHLVLGDCATLLVFCSLILIAFVASVAIHIHWCKLDSARISF
jgi:hypothetical protein